MKTKLICLALSSVFFLVGCGKDSPKGADVPQPEIPIPEGGVAILSQPELPEKGADVPSIKNTDNEPITEADKLLVKGANGFAYKMFAYVASKSRNENLILSPLSWEYAIAMVAAGASDEARGELVNAMGWSSADRQQLSEYHRRLTKDLETTSSERRLFVANALWVDEQRVQKLKADYPPVMLKYFDAAMSVLNLSKGEAIRYINEWIERKSYGKIKNLLSEDLASDDLAMILTNVLYFNTPWDRPFSKADTKKGEFMVATGAKQEVEMLRGCRTETLADLPEAQILRLPTEKKGFFLDIILPKNKKQELTAEFFAKHDPIKVFAKEENAIMRTVDIYLPKYKFTTKSTLLLNDADQEGARQLGLSKITQPGNLMGIMDNPNLRVSKVLQKCMVGWDEKGVEAAAATAVIFTDTAAPEEPVEFKADHPFFFTISHAGSGKLMFLGRVNSID
ncbi:hypothetical protein HQ45_00355 [Porphyromonas crevioricanis]|uniref:Serpin domain-containing protein n=2 Tax=Porphyromonas crevioricanis TaxID=393921 RepID=A0AB34PFY3_9PORP|nr:serpin family protein [Porphyromonas crevioricanis]KGN91270.1 hypothetical protein HQ45_00355 [Porphyromonas crevioricanis]KGN93028.1 hypothetical protein HQ38_09685 [Porphyromonas crevioricanis]GAD05364.1 SeRPin [Porphyromonas crevioricanis JCM 15906]SJZ85318.1 serpin B [Porphyromonas crevioricanis]